MSIIISNSPSNIQDMSDAQSDAMLETGLAQAKANQGVTLDEAFIVLENSIK